MSLALPLRLPLEKRADQGRGWRGWSSGGVITWTPEGKVLAAQTRAGGRLSRRSIDHGNRTPDWKEEIRRRLSGLKLAGAREVEIVEELAQHLDDRYEQLLQGGATKEEAYRAALLELTESDLLAQELRGVERRFPQEPVVPGDQRRMNMLGDLWQDLRYGLRMLVRNPGFTIVAVIACFRIGATARS